jgi:hypothetical protein
MQTSQLKWKLLGQKVEEFNVDGISWAGNESKVIVNE